jgi:hypothetical protein
LPFVSQTPLWQVSVAAAGVHVPLSVGLECAGSEGTAPPFATCGVHMWLVSLHQLPAEQSASTLQPPDGSQVPLVLHMPEMQTVPPFTTVQGPSPFAKPQTFPFVSQTPLWHTTRAAAGVHVPLIVGLVCAGSLGTAVPFMSFGVHAWAVSLHQLPAVQSASTLQPPAGSQRPFTLQDPDWQTTGPFATVQGPSPFA